MHEAADAQSGAGEKNNARCDFANEQNAAQARLAKAGALSFILKHGGGFDVALRNAGTRPKRNPVANETTKANDSTLQSSGTAMERGRVAGLSSSRRRAIHHATEPRQDQR